MNLEKRLEILEGYQNVSIDSPEVIFIDDSDQEITGYSVCHSMAGGDLVQRLPGEPLEELQERCRDLDREFHRNNPLQRTKANSVAFAEYKLKEGF